MVDTAMTPSSETATAVGTGTPRKRVRTGTRMMPPPTPTSAAKCTGAGGSDQRRQARASAPLPIITAQAVDNRDRRLPERSSAIPRNKTSSAYAQALFAGDEPGMRWGRRVFKMLPSAPRCKMCAAPFAAPMGPVMRAFGKSAMAQEPQVLHPVLQRLLTHRGGTEIECSLLFADVRGSTSLAEGMRPTEFSGLMNRFFETASRVLVGKDAMVDKFVGDEVIGIFLPVMTGPSHARHAIDAGRELLAATGNDGDAPWLPIGIGVNTGVSYVGTVGDGDNVDITAMGDPVNVTARLASAAGAGEMLVTIEAAAAANLADTGLEHRRLDLKGKSDTTDVLVVRATR